VRVRAGTPTREQETQYQNGDVRRIAAALLDHHSENVDVYHFVRESMLTAVPRSRDQLAMEFSAADDALESIVTIAEAGANIARLADEGVADRRRAAVLERVVFGLAGYRRNPVREAYIELTVNTHSGRAETGMMDVAVDDPETLEVYECKLTNGFTQDTVNQLGDVFLSARAEDRRCVCCIASFGTRRQLDSRVKNARIELHEVLYYLDCDELVVLKTRPASARLR